MADVIHLDDMGMQEFEIGTARFMVDVAEVYNRIVNIDAQFRDDKGSELAKYQELVKELGGPTCSQATVTKFVNIINDLAEALKKNIGIATETTPSSPTGSS